MLRTYQSCTKVKQAPGTTAKTAPRQGYYTVFAAVLQERNTARAWERGLQPPPLHALLTIREIPDPLRKGRDTMNVFKHRDNFFGYSDSGVSIASLRSLFQLAKQIRLRLGKQGYLMDSYLSCFFDAISTNVPSDAALQGIEMGGEIQRLLYQVMDNAESEKQHPLYERIQEVYKQQKVSQIFQEKHTNCCLLLFPLADEIMDYYITLFIKDLESDCIGMSDMVRFRNLYEQISQLTDESCMVELNRQLQQRFLIAPLALSYAQGITYDLLFKLTARDPETSKQMFQLLLDTMLENREEV